MRGQLSTTQPFGTTYIKSNMHKLLLRRILHVLFWLVQLLKCTKWNMVPHELRYMARTAKVAMSYLQLDLKWLA